MPTSRAVMRRTGSHQNAPSTTSAHIAPRTSALSASGSRNAPERVVPMRRASQPSTPSVAASTDHMAKVPYAGPDAMINPHSNGASTNRVVVTAFGGGARGGGADEVAP